MATDHWQIHEAKNRFSEVVRRACEVGPQTISIYGRDAVVVLKIEEYQELRNRSSVSLVEFFRTSPLPDGVALDISRSDDRGRSVEP
jgi:prevent-host-death family protein